MADQSHNTIFGDTGTGPLQPDRPNDRVTRDLEADQEPENLGVNDEDVEPGRVRSDRPERPSTADDMSNPRTGPIG